MPLLTKLLNGLAVRRSRPGYRSRFGGLWIDRPDARERIAAAQGGDASLRSSLLRFADDGFAILEGAVDGALVDAVLADVEEAWAGRHPELLVELDGERRPVTPAARAGPAKLLDLHARSEAARRVAFAPRLRELLRTLFEDDLLLFQSLYLERGSGQPLHQDTAYVVVVPPLAMAAAWIALEDVRPGSGELVYVPGSQRLPEHLFGSQRSWNRRRDGLAARQAYEAGIEARARALGLAPRTFLPRKGDVLLWCADLVHGGSPVLDPESTRRSLVCHYCPASARPYYTGTSRTGKRRAPAGRACFVSSAHYRVS